MSTSLRGHHKRYATDRQLTAYLERRGSKKKMSGLSHGELYDMSNTSSRFLVRVKVIKP